MNSHRFLGRQLHLSLGPIHPGKFVICQAVKLLPARDGLLPEYQVRNSAENFDRRASQTDLLDPAFCLTLCLQPIPVLSGKASSRAVRGQQRLGSAGIDTSGLQGWGKEQVG
jgi:hypothetical protein